VAVHQERGNHDQAAAGNRRARDVVIGQGVTLDRPGRGIQAQRLSLSFNLGCPALPGSLILSGVSP